MINSDNTINYVPPDDEGAYEEHPIAPVDTTDKPSKDFRKILSKNSKDNKDDSKKKSPAAIFSEERGTEALPSEISDKPDKDDTENATQGVSSVFDLTKNPEVKDTRKTASNLSSQASVAKVESPNELFKRMSSPKLAKTEAATPKKEARTPAVAKNQTPNLYSTEQADLSYVNPLALQSQLMTPSAAPVGNAQIQRPVGMDPNLALLIEKIVKQMYTVEKAGQTDTVMVIDYPPLFKDAKITITAFESAKGQFNISIENLTQQAQKVIELDKNKKALLNELEQKGYTVQMFTTTTIKIENVALSEQQSSHDREQQREGGSPEHRRDRG